MKHRYLLIVACAAVPVFGCTSVARTGALLTGERSVHVTDVAMADPDTKRAIVPVEHVFELSNPGSGPVVIMSSRTRIDTVWHFVDTGGAALPRTIAPGGTLRVAVTAKVRRPGMQRFFVELQPAGGDAVRLELIVNG